MVDTIQPKPCPFCGSELTQAEPGLNFRHPDVECFFGESCVPLDLIPAWNERAEEPHPNFTCDECPMAEPDWCMKAGYCPHRDRKRVAELETALKTAMGHVEHMSAWISGVQAGTSPPYGYSFESLGEDIDGMRAAAGTKRPAFSPETLAQSIDTKTIFNPQFPVLSPPAAREERFGHFAARNLAAFVASPRKRGQMPSTGDVREGDGCVFAGVTDTHEQWVASGIIQLPPDKAEIAQRYGWKLTTGMVMAVGMVMLIRGPGEVPQP